MFKHLACVRMLPSVSPAAFHMGSWAGLATGSLACLPRIDPTAGGAGGADAVLVRLPGPLQSPVERAAVSK